MTFRTTAFLMLLSPLSIAMAGEVGIGHGKDQPTTEPIEEQAAANDFWQQLLAWFERDAE
jgi:hypothetical protein